MKRTCIAAVLCFGLVLPNIAFADLDPRDYVGAPAGTFAMLTYFRHITADTLYNDGDEVNNNFGLTANVEIFRPVYYFDVGGFLVDIQALLITGDQEIDAAGVSSSGIFDPVLLGTVWFINNGESQTWLGFTPYFSIPVGDYDKDKPLNNGENRWKFKEELMLAKGLGNGWFLDVGGSVEFYTDEDDAKKKQDPLWTGELHLSKDITKKWYIGASYMYHAGGETEFDGVNSNDSQNNHTLMATTVFGFDDNYNLQLQYKRDISVESGPETSAFQARLLYFF
ncbi:MAG: transporter [Deferrisomatales bacterium]|nr:transporter [Deferrisomatales bacterium]